MGTGGTVGGAGIVVGVVGARGGAGTTTLAAALAHSWGRATREVPTGRREALGGLGGPGGRRRTGDRRAGTGGGAPREVTPGTADDADLPVVLVDLDATAPGLDVHLGIEAVDGVRWPDLSGARGDVPGRELASLLPVWSGVPVLSGDRWRPGPAPPEVVADVLAALAACHRAVVLDLGRREVLDQGPALACCTVVLVVTPRDLRSVAGVVTLRHALRAAVPDIRLVVRGPSPGGLGAIEMAHVVDLPVAATVPDDRHLPALVERGTGPVPRGGGRFGRAVRRLAADLT